MIMSNMDKIDYELFHGSSVLRCPCQLQETINELGSLSREAQGLHKAITSVDILVDNPDQLLYVLYTLSSSARERRAIGILKVGHKKLFLRDESGEQKEVFPLCILDFYVHESCQRAGYGKALFEHFLQEVGLPAVALAIDRPSQKFLNFLRKHYSLRDAIPQCNNFVIFHGFFHYNEVVKTRRESDLLAERCWSAGSGNRQSRVSITSGISDCLKVENETESGDRSPRLRSSPQPVRHCDVTPLPSCKPVSGLHHSPLW